MKELAENYFKALRDEIISAFEKLENGKKFQRTNWPYKAGQGGGEISVLRGDTFEKAAVNWSGISGQKFPMSDGAGAFTATGISLITHMRNPKAPTVHMNLRYIQTEKKSWFGGGYDLTPMGFPYEDDSKHFHAAAKKALDEFGPDFYPKFSAAAKEYFFIPHRNKERGVGGIFFDHYSSGNLEKDFELVKAVGKSFLPAILPIYERRLHEVFTESDRALQLKVRGHYVEFNLLYDRGTKFGFQSGGNPDAILCSMPPLVSW